MTANVSKTIISSIVAIDRNRVIGKQGGMPWHIPEDFKYFKRTTMGHPIIMGRKSYLALGKPLPGRPNIVISSTFQHPVNDDGPFFVPSVENSIKLAEEKAKQMGVDEIFITGGGQIYKETMDLIDRLYVTIIDHAYDGDTFFPEFDWKDWNKVSEDKREGDPSFTFYVLERK